MRMAVRLLLALVAAAGLTGGEDDALRDHLRKQDAPWYDAGADGWRRVEPRTREAPERHEAAAGSHGIPADVVAWVLIALAAAGIAILVVRAWRAGEGSVLPERTAAPTAIADANLSALHLPPGTRDVEAALAAARARGDWSTAVVLLYARLLLRLGEAGAVVLAPGTTNRAYCRAARRWSAEGQGRAVVPPAVERLAAACEAVRFGGEPADAVRFAALERQETAAATALAGKGH